MKTSKPSAIYSKRLGFNLNFLVLFKQLQFFNCGNNHFLARCFYARQLPISLHQGCVEFRFSTLFSVSIFDFWNLDRKSKLHMLKKFLQKKNSEYFSRKKIFEENFKKNFRFWIFAIFDFRFSKIHFRHTPGAHPDVDRWSRPQAPGPLKAVWEQP